MSAFNEKSRARRESALAEMRAKFKRGVTEKLRRVVSERVYPKRLPPSDINGVIERNRP